ncbi:sodium:solute symporter family transporter [Endozoicomonas ascidiicola]|uniref:sodium:solute symporter family transporter n=1 Tax=Endozoicomonas ascidiicola TaxID=1698521 RepID=UPI00082D1E88|nr:hypothetical protein [Endozoicomonas ascidiicola]
MITIIIFAIPILFILISVKQIKTVQSFKSFALSQNSFGTFGMYCTMLASGVGAGVILGNAEKSYVGAWEYPLGCLGFAVQLLVVACLAPRIYQWRHCLSTGEILGKTYSGSDVRLISGFIWILFCTGIVTAQVLAVERVVAMIIPTWQFEAALVLTASVIIYSCLGGVYSVVYTDVIQSLVLLMALTALGAWGVYHLNTTNPDWFISAPNTVIQRTRSEAFSSIPLIFLGFIFGDALIPITIQRVTMSRSYQQSQRALVLTAFVVVLVVALSALLGFTAFTMEPDQIGNKTFSILIEAMPFWLKLLAIAGQGLRIK